MTPDEAVDMLDHVCQNVPGTRADHIKIVEAVGVLRAAINPGHDPVEE